MEVRKPRRDVGNAPHMRRPRRRDIFGDEPVSKRPAPVSEPPKPPPPMIYQSAADMPGAQPLRNVRYELFSQGLAKGLAQSTAYKNAGFERVSDSTARTAACQLAKRPEIRYRVDYHRRLAADMAGISPEWIAAEIRKIAEAHTRDAVLWGGRGVTLRNSEELDERTSAAVSEVSETKDGVKLKMYSRLDALTKLGQMHKLFVDRKDISGQVGVAQVREITPDMDARLAAEAYADMVRGEV